MRAPQQLILDLRARRRELEITQQDVADHLGISRAAVGHWEIGHSEPLLRSVIGYAHLLDCHLIAVGVDGGPIARVT